MRQLRGNKAVVFIVVDEVSFRRAGHKMNDDDENNVSFVDDGNEAVESLSWDIQYVRDTAVEHERVTQPEVHGTTVTVGVRLTVYLIWSFRIVSIVSSR